MKKLEFLIFILFLNACTSVEDAAKVLRNEKIQNTDEFLVEKRKPLVLPPDLNEIPEPGSISSKNNKNKESNIKEILKVKEEKTQSNKSSSTEESILRNIRK